MNLIKRNSFIFNSSFFTSSLNLCVWFLCFILIIWDQYNKGLYLNSASVKIPIIIIWNLYYKSFTVDSISVCYPNEHKSKEKRRYNSSGLTSSIALLQPFSQFILSINFSNQMWHVWQNITDASEYFHPLSHA